MRKLMKSMSLHFGGFISITPYVFGDYLDIIIFLMKLSFKQFKCVSPKLDKIAVLRVILRRFT